jgi:O-antigen/teichoic acid export membrane protein
MASRPSPEGLTSFVVRRGSLSLVVHLYWIATASLAVLALTRSSSDSDFGAFATIQSTVILIAALSPVGTDRLLTRTIAASTRLGLFGEAAGLLRYAQTLSVIVAAALGLLALVLLGPQLSARGVPDLAIQVGLVPLPFMVLSAVRQGALLGLGRTGAALIPDYVIRTSVLLVLIAGAIGITAGHLNTLAMILADLGALLVAFFVLWVAFRLYSPVLAAVRQPTYRISAWLRSGLQVEATVLGGVAISNMPVLALGLSRGPAAAAQFAVAFRLAALAGTALVAVNAVIAPEVASRWASHDLAGIRALATKATVFSMCFALPITAAYLVFGPEALALFGAAYRGDQGPLILLSAAQVVNVVLGPVGMLLIMTGHERDAAKGNVVALLVVAACAPVLTVTNGVIGAAVSSALAVLALNLSWFKMANGKGLIGPAAFSVLGHGRRTPRW